MILLAITCLAFAAIPAAIFWINLRVYQPPGEAEGVGGRLVSVLIPARNEELGIAACVDAALASTGIDLEVIVMDDGSTDDTARIVRGLAAFAETAVDARGQGLQTSGRLRLEQAPPLPAGWNGKQHACWALANVARGDLLCFVDADVRLMPEAIARMSGFLARSRSQLVSGFPRQITGTWLEQLLLPLIHFILLGYLPLPQMRSTQSAAYAAGCGQFLLVKREAYFASGGHAAIRSTMHDGIKLPRLLRLHGFHTDLADLTPVATCRMYGNAREVWNGLAKNAAEGMGAPRTIVPATVLLTFGQIAPFVLLGWALVHRATPTAAVACFAAAVFFAWLPRFLAVRRFDQPLLSAVFHPAGVAALLAVQWYALIRAMTGHSVMWRSRSYTAASQPANAPDEL